MVRQAKICLNWNINNITAEWTNNNYIPLVYLIIIYKTTYTVLQFDVTNSNSAILNSRNFELIYHILRSELKSSIISISKYFVFLLRVRNGRIQLYNYIKQSCVWKYIWLFLPKKFGRGSSFPAQFSVIKISFTSKQKI